MEYFGDIRKRIDGIIRQFHRIDRRHEKRKGNYKGTKIRFFGDIFLLLFRTQIKRKRNNYNY